MNDQEKKQPMTDEEILLLFPYAEPTFSKEFVLQIMEEARKSEREFIISKAMGELPDSTAERIAFQELKYKNRLQDLCLKIEKAAVAFDEEGEPRSMMAVLTEIQQIIEPYFVDKND